MLVSASHSGRSLLGSIRSGSRHVQDLGASNILQELGSNGTRAKESTKLTEFLGYHWVCLALPHDDGHNPYIHPPLLLPHFRGAGGALELADQDHTRVTIHLPGYLLHSARLHLPPAVHGLAPARTAAVFQRLVLLSHPGGVVQH